MTDLDHVADLADRERELIPGKTLFGNLTAPRSRSATTVSGSRTWRRWTRSR